MIPGSPDAVPVKDGLSTSSPIPSAGCALQDSGARGGAPSESGHVKAETTCLEHTGGPADECHYLGSLLKVGHLAANKMKTLKIVEYLQWVTLSDILRFKAYGLAK